MKKSKPLYFYLYFVFIFICFYNSVAHADEYSYDAIIKTCFHAQCPPYNAPSGSWTEKGMETYSDGNGNQYQAHLYCPAPTNGYRFISLEITANGGDPARPTAASCHFSNECPPPMFEVEGQCVCNDGFSWDGVTCVPDGIDDCVAAIQGSGGNGKVEVDSNNNVHCSVGDGFSGSCSGTFANEACYSQPTGENGDSCSGGAAFGTFNDTSVCVGSAAVSDTGTSDSEAWGETTTGPDIVSEETQVSQSTNAGGDPVTSTSTTTTTETTTTETKPVEEAAPFVCEDGRLSVDLPSCDSAMVCDSGHYLVYGSCVPLPSETTSESSQDTTTTTTTTNQNTGEETTETTSTNTTKPGGSSPGTVKVEMEGLDGPCDPSEPGYFDCVSGEPGAMPDHTNNEGKGLDDGFQEVYNRMKASPVAMAMQSVATIVPDGPGACQPLSMDLSDTIIGTNASTSVHCDIAESIRGVLGAVMMIFYTICAFRIFASA